jgi:hypothetical protein
MLCSVAYNFTVLMSEIIMSQLADVNSVAELEADVNKLIVAFASSGGEIVKPHFGSSLRFHVYGIDGSTATPLAVKSFATLLSTSVWPFGHCDDEAREAALG